MILVVEDEPLILLEAVEKLRGAGHEVVEAKTLAEAKGLFDKNAQNLLAIVGDFRLPDGTAAELYHHVRKVRPDIPFAMVSGYSPGFVEEQSSLPSPDVDAKLRYYRKPANYQRILKTFIPRP